MAGPSQILSGQTRIYKWTLTTADPTGRAIIVGMRGDGSVQAFGTFGGGTVTLDLSLCLTEEYYFAAKDYGGTLIALTADGGMDIKQRTYRLRPKITGSTGATVTVLVLLA